MYQYKPYNTPIETQMTNEENEMFYDYEREERDYEDGVAYTQWLIAKKDFLDAAPVRGEDGWTEELEAERQSVKKILYG